MSINNNISIFLSSTFIDMQSERDIIKDIVCPDVYSAAKKYGCNLDFIDLRWGIDTSLSENEQIATSKILNTCFDEIQKTNPYFIVFIGERYGWVPSSNDVMYSFANRTDNLIGGIDGKSITELEISYAQTFYDNTDKCLFYFRNPIDYGDDFDAKNKFVSTGEELEKINLLKEKLLEKFPNQVKKYNARWNKVTQKIETEDNFAEIVSTDIINLFLSQIEENETPCNWIEECININSSFINRYNSTFVGREDELIKIESFVNNKNKKLLLIKGDSGTGKTAVLSKIASNLKQYDTIPFFVGVNDSSLLVENMISILSYQLSKSLQIEYDINISNTNELISTFYSLLNKISIDKKVIIIIDAINQFSKSVLEYKLSWLNMLNINDNVKIIVSTTTDYYQLEQLEFLSNEIIELNNFNKTEIANVSKKYFAVSHKQINDEIVEELQNKTNIYGINPCSCPIYLLSILDEINSIGYDDFVKIDEIKQLGVDDNTAIINYIKSIVENSPNSLEDELNHVLENVIKKVGDVAEIIACCISLSRHGIIEDAIEFVCKKIFYKYERVDFSYFTKLYKNNLIKRENGEWDFNHILIKTHYTNLFKKKNISKQVVNYMIEYFSSLSDDNIFKQTDYIYYLSYVGKSILFIQYFNNNFERILVKESLTTFINNSYDTDFIKELFNIKGFDMNPISDLLSLSISKGIFEPTTSEIISNIILNYYYSNDNYKRLEIISKISKIYINLAEIANKIGKYEYAVNSLLLAAKLVSKYNKESKELFKIYFLLYKNFKIQYKTLLANKYLKYSLKIVEGVDILDEYESSLYLELINESVLKKEKTLISSINNIIKIFDNTKNKVVKYNSAKLIFKKLNNFYKKMDFDISKVINFLDNDIENDDIDLIIKLNTIVEYCEYLDNYNINCSKQIEYIVKNNEKISMYYQNINSLKVFYDSLEFIKLSYLRTDIPCEEIIDKQIECQKKILSINPSIEDIDKALITINNSKLVNCKNKYTDYERILKDKRRKYIKGGLNSNSYFYVKALSISALTLSALFIFIQLLLWLAGNELVVSTGYYLYLIYFTSLEITLFVLSILLYFALILCVLNIINFESNLTNRLKWLIMIIPLIVLIVGVNLCFYYYNEYKTRTLFILDYQLSSINVAMFLFNVLPLLLSTIVIFLFILFHVKTRKDSISINQRFNNYVLNKKLIVKEIGVIILLLITLAITGFVVYNNSSSFFRENTLNIYKGVFFTCYYIHVSFCIIAIIFEMFSLNKLIKNGRKYGKSN